MLSGTSDKCYNGRIIFRILEYLSRNNTQYNSSWL